MLASSFGSLAGALCDYSVNLDMTTDVTDQPATTLGASQ